MAERLERSDDREGYRNRNAVAFKPLAGAS